MTYLRIATLLAAIVTAAPALAQSAPKPLFASSDVLHLTIRGPINQIARTAARQLTSDATLSVPGAAPETLAIRLTPRGITRLRRDVCQFPPLRVSFSQSPAPDSIFAGQKQLKLVTHCQGAASFQQYLLLEYSVYLLYNQLTPASFRVRLVTIDYVDEANRPITTRFGFFLEEANDVGARNGWRRAVTGDRIPAALLSPADSARVAMFEYMIGNMDWSMRAGPVGEGCCHNSRLFARASGGGYVPVPYDFDYSGLVNPPYAVSPSGGSVLRRQYMGYCAFNAQALAAAGLLRAQRGPLLAVLGQAPLDEGVRRKAAAYLASFYNDIADDRTTTAKVLKTCA
ncbi:hypothetical protein [Sphingomonas sp.]|uniref:hypothetical protein n=1 Tax=Sphingomonas sp. TaxID=28214 RepID=UPI00286C44A7|nr:hypothetical protein [Sphingomonas sp.]